jgi:hypothetical protein
VTENQSGQVGEVGEVEFVEPAVPASEAGPEADGPEKRVRRGRIAAVSACVLLALAVVGGVGYTVVTVNGADRDAGAPTWKFPKAAAEPKAAPAKGLLGVLVPYATSGFGRGPDIAQFGSEAELTGREATALRKEGIGELPRSQRLLLEKQIDREHIKGLAMRSYLNVPDAANSTLDQDHAFTVNVQLAQMDEGAARDIATYQSALLDAFTVFRKGPTIKGHKNARCFLPSESAGEAVGEMVCSAYEGDILVALTASGTKSMDPKSVAYFLREQLDRIKTTGEAV